VQTVQVIRLCTEWMLRKVFCTKSVEVVQNCYVDVQFFSLQEYIAKRRHIFLVNYITSDNILCCICQNSAARELNMLRQP